jgi:hypothetical protein
MSNWNIWDESINLKNSALTLFFGDCLGSGASRRVYSILNDHTTVAKVEYVGRTFNNQTEWLVWQEVKDWPISDWFVPCVEIDSYGNVLLQRRTEVFQCEYDFKAALTRTRGGIIPKSFADIHYGNFGLYDGRVACHDYGYHRFFENGARQMSIDAGYITLDEPHQIPTPQFDVAQGGQLALNL